MHVHPNPAPPGRLRLYFVDLISLSRFPPENIELAGKMARILLITGSPFIPASGRRSLLLLRTHPPHHSRLSLLSRLPTAPHRLMSPCRNRLALDRRRSCRIGGTTLHDRQDNLAGPDRRWIRAVC